MKKFNDLLKKYNIIIEQDELVDAAQPPEGSPQQDSGADKLARQDNLEPNEEFLIDILLQVADVLKSYINILKGKGLSANDYQNELSELDDLIAETNRAKIQTDNATQVLKNFLDKFDSIFESHLKKIEL
jgi:hypothetical protein